MSVSGAGKTDRKAPLLWGVCVAAACAGAWFACASLLSDGMSRSVIVYNLIFSVLAGLAAARMCRRTPLLLAGFLAGLFAGFLAAAFSFEKEVLGSYGVIRMFVALAIGLAVGAVAEAVRAAVLRRRAKKRREAFLADLLYRK